MGKIRRFRYAVVACVTVSAVVLGVPLAVVSTTGRHTGAIVAQAFTQRTLIRGSQGYDVDELQGRLKHLGFYGGKIDGYFGWRTYFDVRNFQYQFGLPITGKVDLKTRQALVQATPNWTANSNGSQGSGAGSSSSSAGVATSASAASAVTPTVPGVSQSDINLMTHMVYGEARGEPFVGQVAIAAVILNRMRDSRFPHSIPAILYSPGAFDALNDGQFNLQPNAEALKAVMDAIHGDDPTHGAVYYFNPATATSKWIWSRPQIITIGHHIFCR